MSSYVLSQITMFYHKLFYQFISTECSSFIPTEIIRKPCNIGLKWVNPLSGNPTKLSNALKQFVGKSHFFGHFLELNGLRNSHRGVWRNNSCATFQKNHRKIAAKPANIYLFKVNNRNTRKRSEICSNTKHQNDVVLVFLLLTSNICHFLFQCFYY